VVTMGGYTPFYSWHFSILFRAASLTVLRTLPS